MAEAAHGGSLRVAQNTVPAGTSRLHDITHDRKDASLGLKVIGSQLNLDPTACTLEYVPNTSTNPEYELSGRHLCSHNYCDWIP